MRGEWQGDSLQQGIKSLITSQRCAKFSAVQALVPPIEAAEVPARGLGRDARRRVLNSCTAWNGSFLTLVARSEAGREVRHGGDTGPAWMKP
jgi:hypothetical protein